MHRKFRWSKVYESSEEELVTFLQSRGLKATRVTAEAMTEQLQQVSDAERTVWCAEGSLVLRQGSATVSLQPGDAVAVETNVPYDLIAGITGYVCYVTN